MDYYKITVPIDGRINFWLGNIPAGCDYDLIVFNEEEMMEWVSTTENDYEEILGQSVTADDVYYIVVGSYSGYSSLQYSLRVRIYLDSYAYFAQTAPSTTTDYVMNFDKIYDEDYLTASDWQALSWYTNLSMYGCYSCSFAMVLRNLNKTTVRAIPNVMVANGSSIPQQYMLAQPYTILWANTTPSTSDYSLNSLGTTFTYNGTYYTTAFNASDMCYTKREAISTLFDVTIKAYNVDGFYEKYGRNQSEAIRHKKNAIANLLSKNPEGIIAVFYNELLENPEHAIVITSTTFQGWEDDYSDKWTITTTYPHSDELNYSHIDSLGLFGKSGINYAQSTAYSLTETFSDGDLFTVCDPGRAENNEYCNQVSLNDTYSARFFDWTHLIALITID